MKILKGITWDHSRGFTSVVATAQRFHELHPDVDIVWEKRSLQAFADENLEQLAKRYDLLIIDNPWSGTVAKKKWLLPLEEHLDAAFLKDQSLNSVGQSHKSYYFNEHLWALAIDAACPVSAYRPDLLDKAGEQLPVTWHDVMQLAKKGLVCCPSIPLDVYGNFLNILVSSGKAIFENDEEVATMEDGLYALKMLKEFQQLIPEKFYSLNPIKTLELMSVTDEAAYTPFTYGYANYSRKNYNAKHLKFSNPPQFIDGKAGSTMLGGTGIAVSASCKQVDLAMQYAVFTTSAEMQTGIFFDAGGQPGYRGAWTSETVNAQCDQYFMDTLPALDAAFVRPRYAGYLDFQDVAGDPIHAYLKHGGNAREVLEKLNTLYRENKKANA